MKTARNPSFPIAPWLTMSEMNMYLPPQTGGVMPGYALIYKKRKEKIEAMAVLIEGISVVIKTAVIVERYPKSWGGFREDVPNQTLCAHGELLRIGFLTPGDTREYIEQLGQYGIQYIVKGQAKDLVVVDQRGGMGAPCD